MASTSAPSTSCDAFLGGRVQALQPAKGYRAGVDAVFLAAACPASQGDKVLELGCGVGVASLCLRERCLAEVTGVEVQPEYASLARQNGLDVVEADLRDLPPEMKRPFDHVIANPPYFDRQRSVASYDAGKDLAFGGDTPLADWVACAARRLRPGGFFTMIASIEQLPEALAAAEGKLGSVTVLPLSGRDGHPPKRMILWAKKEGRAPFYLAAPFVIHQAARHEGDHPDYTPDAQAILADAQRLTMPRKV